MAEAATQWISVEQAFPDIDRAAELRAAQFVGSLVVSSEIQVNPVETEVNSSTLMANIQLGALGSESARRMVGNNVKTDVGERFFKVATQNQIWLEIVDGRFTQEGISTTDIHRNTLVHTILNNEMYSRTTGQLKNGFVFEELLGAGILDTHDALVLEPCPTDEQTKKDYNFFADTDSLSMQLLKVEGGQAVLETALVAGKKTAISPRHDVKAIYEMAANNGVELIPTNINGIVQYVMLIPKRPVPNAIEDVVAEYDKASGGTFYGQDRPAQDYHQYAQECYDRNDSFNDIVEQITDQLIADAPAFETPLEAIERLDYLSERLCVRRTKTDRRIDSAVFGPQAAFHIEEARRFFAQGDHVAANEAIIQAQKTAVSGSCPLFKDSSRPSDSSDSPKNDSLEKSETKWMHCPHCDAKVFADPCAPVLKCWDCKAAVVNGLTVSKGNGGSKKRKEAKIKAQAQLTAV